MATVVEPISTNRVLTFPNLITTARLLCIPWFLYLLFGKEDRAQAAILLAVLGTTDWVDGYVARRFDQVTELGKILDPAADRLLFIVGIGGMIIDGAVPWWFSILVVFREVVLGAALVILTMFGMKRFDVTFLGKTATCFLMVAFPLFLMGASDVRLAEWFNLAGWICGIPGLLLSYYTAISYVPLMRRSLAEGRATRTEGS